MYIYIFYRLNDTVFEICLIIMIESEKLDKYRNERRLVMNWSLSKPSNDWSLNDFIFVCL